ncbi:FAD-binding oxidoreductase [Aequorivita sp. H23M31]|uniref:FAD-binding oxidoreductase n=1 Tax=Aequorivita ciconiae TaxID=2494375 RepID=A0A410G3C4_9FLAO|nr:FAD-dependent oxidoreductase [Aequorivita sp. H23M31]QAA81798.1 FAD-binding oxidoreductase [Aequorivita sp. H23M31]
MKEVEYIVVGLGIAGICFCEQLRKNGKSFIAIDNGRDGSTARSGGVLNPTVLKRFNAAWNSSEFYPAAISFYQNLSKALDLDLFRETPILRVFKSVEEQNDWSVASDKRELQSFLSSSFVQNDNPNIAAPFGFGEVMGTLRIDTKLLLNEYQKFLTARNQVYQNDFDYKELSVSESRVVYQTLSSKKIVFCDGVGAMHNPFFPENGIIPNKGEYLIVNAPDLKLEVLLKGPMYIIPIGNSLYKVGGTFGRDDFSEKPTAKARQEILTKLKSMINCSFEVVDQTVGIRPTTRDRKPLIGSLPDNPRIGFLNGLGSRGFTMAPLLSQILFNNISSGIPIPKDMDINRLRA